jgi:hypothetical protein
MFPFLSTTEFTTFRAALFLDKHGSIWIRYNVSLNFSAVCARKGMHEVSQNPLQLSGNVCLGSFTTVGASLWESTIVKAPRNIDIGIRVCHRVVVRTVSYDPKIEAANDGEGV